MTDKLFTSNTKETTHKQSLDIQITNLSHLIIQNVNYKDIINVAKRTK